MRRSAGTATRIAFSYCLFCGLTILWVSFARAQSDADVHIVPRTGERQDLSKADSESAVGVPSPHVHKPSFHVDVDLVLVPVTVSDAMQRPVMNLSKQDF